jgi:hypothetical protein
MTQEKETHGYQRLINFENEKYLKRRLWNSKD